MTGARKLMLFWSYFIGLGAVLGAVMFFIDPSGVMWGMESILPILMDKLPPFATLFNDFTASGIALFIVVGIPNLVSIILTHRRSRYAILMNAMSGWMLIGWIVLEFYIWGFLALSVAYLFFGIVQLGTAIFAYAKLTKLKRSNIE